MSEARTDDYLIIRTKRLTHIARAQLIWERYAPVLALGLAFAAGFLILTFSGVWQYLGDPWRGIALIIALAILSRAAWHAQKISLPNSSDAKRRIELDSGLKHRPLDVISDRPALNGPALGDKDSAWQNHMARAREDADRAARPIWRAVLAPLDRYQLRFILPLCLAAALIFGLGDNRERLRRAVSPSWQHGMSIKNASFEAWIDPPAYTGRPPIYFKTAQSVEIPEGSTLITRVNGLKTVPRLKLALKGKTRYAAPSRLGPRLFETRHIITKSGIAQYRLGGHKEAWGLNVIPDLPPVITIDEPPSADKRDRLVVTYSLLDDYGVEDMQLVMRRLDGIGGETMVSMPVSARKRKANRAKMSLDLTKHIWAGRKVSGYLKVVDGYGHETQSDPAYFIIPDKIFVEPLAKAIIENRQLLLEAKDSPYTPEPRLTRKDINNYPIFDQYQPRNRLDRAAPQVKRVAALLDVITDQPSSYFEDPALLMGLNFIKSELRYANETADIANIPEELWKVALRAEFGTLGTALEELREAQRALREAISRRAAQRETATLFDRYNGAVENYLEELRRKALEDPTDNDGNDDSGGGGANTDQDEIQALLKAIEEANRIGDVDSARRALAQLAELLENLEIELSPSGGGGGGEPLEGEISEEMREALEELAELLGEQRELESETERSQREAQNQEEQQGQEQGQEQGQQQPGQQPGQGQPGQQPGQDQGRRDANNGRSLNELREQQQSLSDRLAQLRDQVEGLQGERLDPDGESVGGDENENGEVGGGSEDENGEAGGGGDEDDESVEDNLGRALEATRESDDALGRAEFSESLEQMRAAIEALRNAGNSLAEEAAGREGGGEGEEGQNAENSEDDPFGREDGLNGDLETDTQVDLDNKNRQKRARELLEELRNRAAEEGRDQLEKDYLERLLKQF